MLVVGFFLFFLEGLEIFLWSFNILFNIVKSRVDWMWSSGVK